MQQSDPVEIVKAVFNTFPADCVLSFADTMSARWLSEDCIRVVVHTRRYVTESWFGAHIEVMKICGHRNWKYACDACKLHVENTLENYFPHLRKEPGKL